MAEAEENTEKPFEPTARKLEQARKKGEVPRSVDLQVAAAYGGLLLVLVAFGADSAARLGAQLAGVIDRADEAAATIFDGAPSQSMSIFVKGVLAAAGPWFVAPAVLVLLTIIAQRAFLVTPDKLKPKLSRISPISNAKNKFGRAGLFEFAKSFAKLLVYSLIMTLVLRARLGDMLGSIQTGPGIGVALMARLCLEFLFAAFLVALLLGVVDMLWQRQEHLRKNRMSRKEMVDETKDAEGDPHLKQARRQRAEAVSQRQMMADVPAADVVIVNPLHYAVALKWSRKKNEAPVCVAKGVDEIAARIRACAQEAGVPIHRDPPVARALRATVDIGEEIQPEHYRPVAAAIRFAEAMRKKAWRRNGRG